MAENELVAFTDEGHKTILKHLETLRVDLGASGALLFDQTGQLLSQSGGHGDLDVNHFLALLGNAMSASNDLVHLLRDESAFDLHFHEGQTYDLHTARINDQIFLTLIFERHTGSSRIGMIWIALRRSVTDLRQLIKNARVRTVPTRAPLRAEPRPAPSPQPPTETAESIAPTISQRARRLNINDIFARSPSEPLKRSAEPAPKEIKPTTNESLVDFDWDTDLTDESETRSAAPISPAMLTDPNHVLTYEEARALGLINLDNSDDRKK